MSKLKTFAFLVIALIALAVAPVGAVAQNRTTGSIKGRVRLQGQGPARDVTITVRQKDKEVAHASTNQKGEFQINNLTPGSYGLTFRKPGLSMGALEAIEVKAGKTHELPDRLILTINEAAFAKLGGSVFNEGGLSVPNVRIELWRVESNGAAKRIDARVTNETGQFVFARLSPDKALYRVTAKADGTEPKTQDVEIDGAMVYRVAFTIERPPR